MESFTNVAAAHRRALPSFARQPAISSEDEVVLDHTQLVERSARLAAGLATRGLRPGDRVALAIENGVEFFPVLLAIWYAGATVVPIAPSRPPEEIAGILQDAEAKLCVVEPEQREAIAGALSEDGYRPRLVDRSAIAQLEGHPPLLPRSCPDGPDGVAWLLYTSGTTGRPKGVMLSHANIAALVAGYLEQVDAPRPGQSLVHLTPLTRISGLAGLAYLLRGANQVIPSGEGSLEPDEVLALVDRWRDSALVLRSSAVARLARRAATEPVRVRSLRTIIYGCQPMHRRDAERALDVFGPKLVQLYGLGEAPMSVVLPRDEHPPLVGARRSVPLPVGRARAGIELRVVDDEGSEVPEGAIGQVLLRGPSIMRGYWNAPEATAQALREGWLHTGDLGWRDEQGRLVFVGRAQDVIRGARGTVHPHAVERHLLRHPAIRELAIVGRPVGMRGDEEEPIAFVCRRPGVPVGVDQLVEHCRALPEHERPVAFIFVDALPRNGSGKVLRGELRGRVASRASRPIAHGTERLAYERA